MATPRSLSCPSGAGGVPHRSPTCPRRSGMTLPHPPSPRVRRFGGLCPGAASAGMPLSAALPE
eukprot:4880702-Lingulodinium_polyedra.AAC.1